MIRDVVIHINNEQPLLADLFSTPTAADAGLVCTNVRTVDGKRPIFIDRSESVFFFPYLSIRFLEISQAAIARHTAEGGDTGAGIDAAAGWMADATGSALVPMRETDPAPQPGAGAGPGPDEDLEIDEVFLRRIRDI